ncbi:hypothetical protein ACOMICROBIO_LKFPLAJE_00211 [Vibrio sp. B1FIG11]|uniref:lipopolysaccharide biosynthesis protein n=1 Tax=Vibrio sp. B1FIG11 TaxID=2751177 RepID=UPI0015F64D8D|nr:hypothetical protein [Vibrio sp. B1FIG11]CAE6881159.1 hypothetical protein ACOMICROBIO_LKFPLAJE_00211 [Vibrio sp. B1FIG11]
MMFKSLISSSVKLAQGSIISSFILMLAMPILTRLYDPSQFGLYGAIISISSIISVGLFFRFELSLAKRKRYELRGYFYGAFIIISIPLSIIWFLLVYFFVSHVDEWKSSAFWITLLATLSAWTFSAFYLLTLIASKNGFLKEINNSKIKRNMLISFLQIFLGIINPTYLYLAFSEFIGRLYSVFYLFKKQNIKIITSVKYTKTLAIRNFHYIKYSFPAALINSVTSNTLPIFYPMIYGVGNSGVVVLVIKVLAIPISLLGQSLSTSYNGFVSKKENQEKYNEVRSALHNLILALSAITLLFFIVVYYLLTFYYDVLFGEHWVSVGEVFLLLSPSLFFQVVFSSFSQSLNIYGLQKFQFRWDTARLLLVFSAITLPNFLTDDGIYLSLSLYSLVMSVMYIFQFLYFDRFLMKKNLEFNDSCKTC